MYVRYAGSYLLYDLERMRLSVTNVKDANDAFELHVIKGEALTPETAKVMITKMIEGSEHARALLLSRWPETKTLTYEGIPDYAREIITKNAFEYEERNLAEARERFKETYIRHCRMMSFCKWQPASVNELLMWAYYSAGHKGLRLHVAGDFLFQKGNSAFEILYSETPPKLHSHLHPMLDKKEYDKIVDGVFRSKSSVWKHEEETRLLINRNKCFEALDYEGKTREFTAIKASEVIRIDLGAKYDGSVVRVDELKRKYPNLSIYKAKQSDDSYALTYERIDKVTE